MWKINYTRIIICSLVLSGGSCNTGIWPLEGSNRPVDSSGLRRGEDSDEEGEEEEAEEEAARRRSLRLTDDKHKQCHLI